ncbi:MAG: hypothetical protein WCL00_10955, partial [Bacteroidota bacterium]
MKTRNIAPLLIAMTGFLFLGTIQDGYSLPTRISSGQKIGDAPSGIIFQENFNGLTALPAGWSVYAQDSWDMIIAQNDKVLFFKQSTGVKTLILSTPLIDLTNASQLTFDFQSAKVQSTLKIGTMSDPNNPATFQLLTTFQPDTNNNNFTVNLSGQTGSTHLAFNWVGAYFKSAYLDNVIVYDNGTQNNVPSNVTNLQFTANPLGANSGSLSWKNPTIEADGGTLTDLDSIVVEVNGLHYSTLINPVIGANQNITVNVTGPGLYTAKVTPYNTTGEGISNTSSQIWIGLDVPGLPLNVHLSQVGNLATITWSPPKVGAHGAYFDGIMTENILARADGLQATVPGSDSVYTVNVTDPGTYNYKVTPYNSSGEGFSDTSNIGVFLIGNYLLWEDFWVKVPAFHWSVQGENYYNWWKSPTSEAGGDAPEMLFQSTSPYFTVVSRAISPLSNTSGKNALTLEFRHAQGAYSNYDFKVQTSSDLGASWHDAW